MNTHPALKKVVFNEYGYMATFHDLTLKVTDYKESDGKMWRHASVSRRDRKLPTHEDLLTLKRLCIGDDKTALQVFPPKDQHFSGEGYSKEVLHLWCCLDGDVTPDFRKFNYLTGRMEV